MTVSDLRAAYRWAYYLLSMIVYIGRGQDYGELEAETQATVEYAYQQLGRALGLKE